MSSPARACTALFILLPALPSLAAAGPHDLVALKDLRPEALVAHDAAPELTGSGGNVALWVRFGHKDPWPGVAVKAPDGGWDLSSFAEVEVEVRHVQGTRVRFG